MGKSAVTEFLEWRLFQYADKQGVYGCFEVTIGEAHIGMERVDYLTYETDGTVRCYEIKATKKDFKSGNKNTFVGDLNYYVMPDELYAQVKDLIPEHVGVLTSFKESYLECAKKPKRVPATANIETVKYSLLRSLSRDADKHYREKYGSIEEARYGTL